MDNNEDYSSVSNLELSTERDFILTFVTTMKPWDIDVIDKVFEADTMEGGGMFILYGLGGILIFFVIYMICYSYCLHMKEAAGRQERELRRLNATLSRISYHNGPLNEGRVFLDNGNEIITTPPRRLIERAREIVDRMNKSGDSQGEEREIDRIFEPRIPFFRPPHSGERRFFPEDFTDILCSNTTIRTVTENSQIASESDGHNQVERDIEWMVEPPLSFSSPHESKDRLYSSKDFKDILNKSVLQTKKRESINSNEEIFSPTKNEATQSLPSEGRSKSSPTSPDILRRRIEPIEGTPRRPSSWM